MTKYIFLTLFFISTMMSSQTTSSDSNLNSVFVWTAAFGVNIVDNDGQQFEDVFKTSNWNFGNPLSINIERKVSNLFAGNFAITLNKLTTKNEQNFETLDKDRTLFAIDATVKFFYDEFFMPNERYDPFESYLLAGLGYTTIGINSTATFDIGFGFNFWFFRDFGLRLQTMGKFGKDQQYLRNYLQHTAEVIYRF